MTALRKYTIPDTKKYNLIAYTSMPNHIHLVFVPIIKQSNCCVNVERFDESLKKEDSETKSESGDSLYIVTKIMQDFKKFTARESNKILKRTGQFWQHESYDHVVRNQDELNRIVEYILNNPVKARLCENQEKWKWNYYNLSYLI